MKLKMKVTLEKHSKDFIKLFQEHARDAVEEGAEVIRLHIEKEMDKPKTGRTYSIPHGGGTYIASAPGEYPARPTSELYAGIMIEVVDTTRNISAYIGTDVPHGAILEDARHKGHRLWLRRGYNESRSAVEAVITKNLENVRF